MSNKIYSGIDNLPSGDASDIITPGCIVLEGGAFRGLYGEGVLDAFMENDLNFECTIGVSAGALNGMNYVSGQIGRSARVNLRYRHDDRYVSFNHFNKYGGIISFEFVTKHVPHDKLNYERLKSEKRRFIAVATNCYTAEPTYFETGICWDILRAIQASASMPYVSKMVYIDNIPYLDGGCSGKIAYKWALEQNYKNIVIVRTRPKGWRSPNEFNPMPYVFYPNYPEFAQRLAWSEREYNEDCAEIEKLQKEGRIFVVSPTRLMHIGILETDMEKLGELYYLGYNDGLKAIEPLKQYLNRK